MTPLDLLARVAAADPERPIVVDAGGAEPITTSRGALLRRSLALAAELVDHGVGPGDCVAVWLPNWADALIWQFAAIAREAHVIGINTRYNVEEVAHVLAEARPKVGAIAHGFHGLDLSERLHGAMRLAKGHTPSIAVVAAPGSPRPDIEACTRYDVGAGTWVPSGGEREPSNNDFGRGEALAVAFATSGSTGKPKLAAHTAGAVAEHAVSVVSFDAWSEADVTLCALPLTGVFSYVPAMATIAAGGTCVLEPVFDADRIVRQMHEFGVTRVIGADDIVGRIAEAWKANPVDLPDWRRILIADFNGKSQELAKWAESTFEVKVSAVYGSSELFSLLAIRPRDEPLPRRWRGGGTPVSHRVEVRVADPATGAAPAPGQTGELQFRGPTVVDAYLGRPELRKKQLAPGGWFRSGDMGRVAEDGSFDYICRMGDALRLRGFLVEPAEIEARIAAHPEVALNKVVGLRLADGETIAVAFAQLRTPGSIDGPGLCKWCAEGLAAYKVPRSIHIVDTLPTTSGVNGLKIRTTVLREWAEKYVTAAEQGKTC